MTIDERLNDSHEWQTVGKPNEVSLSPSVARRLHRLYVRAEMASEANRVTQQAFQETLIELFENAGLSMDSSDRYSIDWRTNTLTLRPEEGSS